MKIQQVICFFLKYKISIKEIVLSIALNTVQIQKLSRFPLLIKYHVFVQVKKFTNKCPM